MKKKQIKYYIFIVIFLCTLILPNVVYMASGRAFDTENKENRKLAEFPVWGEETWDSYFPALEKYINDHAAFKNEFVKAYNLAGIRLFQSTDIADVIVGQDGWLYLKNEDAYQIYKKANLPDEEQLETIRQNVQELDRLCKEEGVEFVLNINPSKEQIYPEYMPEHIKVADGPSRTDVTVDYLRANTDIPIVYPKEEIMENKAQMPQNLYYRYDSHWNKLGAFVGAQQILEQLGQPREFLADKQIVEGEQISGDLARLVNMEDIYDDDTEYSIQDYKQDIVVEVVEKSDDGYVIKTKSNSPNQKRLVMICDSYNNNMRDYLMKNFSECVFLRRELIEKKDAAVKIMDYEPDILVYETVDRLQEPVLVKILPRINNNFR